MTNNDNEEPSDYYFHGSFVFYANCMVYTSRENKEKKTGKKMLSDFTFKSSRQPYVWRNVWSCVYPIAWLPYLLIIYN